MHARYAFRDKATGYLENRFLTLYRAELIKHNLAVQAVFELVNAMTASQKTGRLQVEILFYSLTKVQKSGLFSLSINPQDVILDIRSLHPANAIWRGNIIQLARFFDNESIAQFLTLQRQQLQSYKRGAVAGLFNNTFPEYVSHRIGLFLTMSDCQQVVRTRKASLALARSEEEKIKSLPTKIAIHKQRFKAAIKLHMECLFVGNFSAPTDSIANYFNDSYVGLSLNVPALQQIWSALISFCQDNQASVFEKTLMNAGMRMKPEFKMICYELETISTVVADRVLVPGYFNPEHPVSLNDREALMLTFLKPRFTSFAPPRVEEIIDYDAGMSLR